MIDYELPTSLCPCQNFLFVVARLTENMRVFPKVYGLAAWSEN